jgi:hypothetical protein
VVIAYEWRENEQRIEKDREDLLEKRDLRWERWSRGREMHRNSDD